MTFLEKIFNRLENSKDSPVVQEIRNGAILDFTGGEILARVGQARWAIRSLGLKNGDRCVLLAPNSFRWIAADLALMAEGVVVVPLYVRQAPGELAAIIEDANPAHILCADPVLVTEVRKHWPDAPQATSLDDLFAAGGAAERSFCEQADLAPVTIIYTSGTSGEPKGVVLNAGNVSHMIPCTNGALDQLMAGRSDGRPDRIFHYGPFCFAASWILLLTALSRHSVFTLSIDLSKLSDELKLAQPDYFINVPIFLERVRRTIEEAIQKRGGFASAVFARARRGYCERRNGDGHLVDSLCLSLADRVMFPAIRKGVGANLKALICGSAPLSPETQLFFMMLGIPVLQVYGLTETTAICTLDAPRNVEPGHVGHAIPGAEMIAGENGEILVRGPHIFPGYWRRPAETAKALECGWFHTGDLGEANANGNWRITGRVKDLIILSSGHNVAPEPLERDLARRLPEALQIVVVGNQRSFLTILVTAARNGLTPAAIQAAMEAMNADLPHYKQIRAFQIVSEPFTPENGLMTTMGKMKRDAIAARYASEIDRMYRKKSA